MFDPLHGCDCPNLVRPAIHDQRIKLDDAISIQSCAGRLSSQEFPAPPVRVGSLALQHSYG